MALASTYSATLEGVNAHLVTVEANIGPGLPGTYMVGLGDAAVRESRDRIRTAVANSQLPWPRTKIMVSLSPANLPKSGSHFDLPIALAVLAALDPRAGRRLATTLVLGELGLGGRLRRIEGALPLLHAAPSEVTAIIVPEANAAEAALLGDDRIRSARTLAEVWDWLVSARDLARPEPTLVPPVPPAPDFRDIAGQAAERHALEVAAAGGHHVLMIGPPGTGKSMLAQRLPSILPPLSASEMIEATAIHSVSGAPHRGVVAHRPFVAPHPSLSQAALIGGGSGVARPGAVSQAHRGVLFLDEASEISPAVLDALRIPLETGMVRLTRARREVTYPADVQLVLAANTCKCGAASPAQCTCRAHERAAHLRNISGPLRDRIDITLLLTPHNAVLNPADAEPSAPIAERVACARERAQHRWARAECPGHLNARIDPTLLRRHYPATEDAMALVAAYLADGTLTQRGVDSILRLSWTLADLGAAARPDLDHVARAIDLRQAHAAGVFV
ncbi:YifB family Mg chelatase-like AAA ATPase [Corynebacterium timonense]|uniref:Magnesium chelatase family protein n=1 Tax=Corynebacterium timonense TaxID=441500 RepID=A0A1H1MYE8_9CORY|nr:YifB family Mg chelatase-like AAA ATPase [Corynebacterium timonense]SDR91901.1 magnesium chelatase family protein [Corynebacterium timonense]